MMQGESSDTAWMQHALRLAHHAEKAGEVPVGAVLVRNSDVIAEGWNSSIARHDPSAHAEIMALRQGGENLGNYRLVHTTLYVTLEPCAMCVGAMIQARIDRLVFGAYDPKAGAVQSVFQLLVKPLNHEIAWEGGVLNEACGALLKQFFQARR